MAIPFLERFTIQRYRALNDSFGNPFVFALTDRGFFSEVNNLMDAMTYGLVLWRRLIVDQTAFGSRAATYQTGTPALA